MAKYEQICGKRTKGINKYAKYCKRRAVRASSKRIVTLYLQGYEERMLGENPNSHKAMAGWTD